jgi:hypothetical protein
MEASALLLALGPLVQNIENMLEESQEGRKRTWFSCVCGKIFTAVSLVYVS